MSSTASHPRSQLKEIMSFTQKFQDLHHKSMAACKTIYKGFYALPRRKLLERHIFGGRHFLHLGRELRSGEGDPNFIDREDLKLPCSITLFFFFVFHIYFFKFY